MVADRVYWLRLVESRVNKYLEGADPSSLLGAGAVDEADCLLALMDGRDALDNSGLDVEALVALGWLYWLRTADSRDSQHFARSLSYRSEAEFEAAVTFFTLVSGAVPGMLPSELRELLDHGLDTAYWVPGRNEFEFYLNDGYPPALDLAVERMRTYLIATGGADPRRASQYANFSTALRERFKLRGQPEDIDEAVESASWAVSLAEGERHRGVYLSVLACAQLTRFLRFGCPDDLEASVACFQSAVHDRADPASANPVIRTDLGRALVTRFECRGDVADLDAAVAVLREVLAEQGHGEESSESRTVLALALCSRFTAAGARADLDEAVVVSRAAAEACTQSGVDVSGAQSALASALAERFSFDGDLADLHAAIAAARGAAQAAPGFDRLVYQSDLGDLLCARFNVTDDKADLDEAIDLIRKAVDEVSRSSPHSVTILTNLAHALQSRHECTGSLADIDEAVALGRQAVATAISVQVVGRARAATTLGLALHARFEASGEASDLDDAVAAAREALEAIGDRMDNTTYLSNLGMALRARFLWIRAPRDLDEAVDITVRAARAGGRTNAFCESNLAAVLALRFEHRGRSSDLHDAVAAARNAVELPQRGRRPAVHRLINLSAALYARFESLGAVDDIGEAIYVARASVSATGSDSALRAACQSMLSAALRSRYERYEQTADLDDAIAAARDAVHNTLPRSPDLAGRWSNLGTALLRRATAGTGQPPQDLTEAVAAVHSAVDAATTEGHDYAAMCSNLAVTLLAAHIAGDGSSTVVEAVRWAREAVRTTPEDQPDRVVFLANLGDCLAESYEATGDEETLHEALSAFVAGAHVVTAPPLQRQNCARRRGILGAASGRAQEAAAGFADEVRLLNQSVWHGLDRRSQEERLVLLQGAASDAGAWMISAQDYSTAVELLELGRAVLWSQLLDANAELTDLSFAAPELHREFVEVRAELNRAPSSWTQQLFA